MRDYSVSIIIPCRNEAGTIEEAVKRIPKFGVFQELIFVEGHSTDNTVEEILRVQREYPDTHIRFFIQNGEGKGDAVRKGFSRALGSILMILDADLTVPPEDLPMFYGILKYGGVNKFVNGCRFTFPQATEAMKSLNWIANKFFSMVFSYILGQRITDTLCGTKALYKSAYKKIQANRDYFGDFDPFGDFDLLFGASRLGMDIIEIPIHYQDRKYGTTNISRFKHGWLLLKMVIFAWRKFK